MFSARNEPHARTAPSGSIRRSFWGACAPFVALGWLAGCSSAELTGTFDDASATDGTGAGAGAGVGTGNPGTGSGGTGSGNPGQNGGGGDGNQASDCVGDENIISKRLVRLSFNQVANSIATLIDQSLQTNLVETFELVDAQHRAFPPLQSPREGNSFTDQSWDTADRIAQAAGEFVSKNLDKVTGCGADPTDDCALEYLLKLAERGYRRALTADEKARLSTLYTTGLKGVGASTPEAIQYGVYAIFQAPQFLYRTEFGSPSGAALTQNELASMLSYFLTDNTPDDQLLAAAEQGALSDEATIAAHVERILKTEEAKVNIEGAMLSYFAYPNLEKQIIQDDAFDGDMRRSMYREAELFLSQTLWNGTVNDLLTSKKGYVDAKLAPVYGFEMFPPPGAKLVEGSFYEVTLPDNRTGLMTQAGFLANRSRPDHTSVVGRGLLIKAAFLCTETPPPDDAILGIIEKLGETMPDASEREMAELRAMSPACAECHHTFDPYGLALDRFDVIGRYREVDDHGRPIDPSVTLPDIIGGGEANNVVEVAQRLAESGAFAKCIGQNLINYALADVSAGAANVDSCAVKRVADKFAATDGTFSSLVKVVATSAVLSQRTQGDAQ
jgi:hypothetical protein